MLKHLREIALLVCLMPMACAIPCERLAEEAEALVDTAATCAAGDSCVVVTFSDLLETNPCLGAFHCSAALNTHTDLAALAEEAEALIADYRSCDMCAQAGCITPPPLDAATCNSDKGRCELVF